MNKLKQKKQVNWTWWHFLQKLIPVSASILIAEAKVYANDAALQISEKLLELGGSRSSLSQHNLDQHWRNARVHTLHDPIRWKLHALGNYYLNNTFPARHAWI